MQSISTCLPRVEEVAKCTNLQSKEAHANMRRILK